MTLPAPVRRIALPTDLAQGSEQVFAHGLAVALHDHAVLHLVHVHPADSEAVYWNQLPSVRDLLVRWGQLPTNADAQDLKSLRTQVVLRTSRASTPPGTPRARSAA